MSKTLVSTGLKLLFSAAIIVIILKMVPFTTIAGTVLSAKPELVVVPFLIVPLMFLLIALQTHVLTKKQGMGLTVGNIFEVLFTASFYNIFLPGQISSGAVYWYKFAKHEGKRAEALAAVAFGRIMDSLIIQLCGMACWLADPVARQYHVIGVVLAVMCLFVLTGYILFLSRRALRVVKTLARMVAMPDLARKKLDKFFNAVSHFHLFPPGEMVYSMVLLTVRQVLGIISFYVFARSLSIDIAWISMGWIRTFTLSIAMLPISCAGIGVRDAGLIALLSIYHIPSVQAVALSFLLLARTVGTGMVGGLVEANSVFFGTEKGKTPVRRVFEGPQPPFEG